MSVLRNDETPLRAGEKKKKKKGERAGASRPASTSLSHKTMRRMHFCLAPASYHPRAQEEDSTTLTRRAADRNDLRAASKESERDERRGRRFERFRGRPFHSLPPAETPSSRRAWTQQKMRPREQQGRYKNSARRFCSSKRAPPCLPCRCLCDDLLRTAHVSGRSSIWCRAGER